MDEMAGAVANTMANTRQTVRTAAVLSDLAAAISGLIGRVRTDRNGRPNGIPRFTAAYPVVSGNLPPTPPSRDAHDPDGPHGPGQSL
jgi:hypothetical protein